MKDSALLKEGVPSRLMGNVNELSMVVMTTSGRDPSWPDCQGNTQIPGVLSAGSFSILRCPEVKFPWVEGQLASVVAVTLHMICICLWGACSFFLAFST